MERKHFLIHRHTSHIDNMPTDLKLGEIAVRHHDEKPELIINLDEANGDFRTFIDKAAVEKLITATSTNISGEIDSLSGAIESIHTELEKYDTAEEAQVKIDAAKDAAIAAASAYTDGQVSAAKTELSNAVNGVAANVTALSGVVEDHIEAVTEEFKKYDTTTVSEGKIATAKGEAIAAASAYTDGQVSAAKTELSNAVNGVSSRVVSLENISGLTLTAIQNITGLSGATITGETQRTIDFSNMIIDCGTF